MPAYLYVHGVVLTTWFVLVFAQTCLVAAHRIHPHRRLGVVAAVVAIFLVPISTFVVVRFVPRAMARGSDSLQIQDVVIFDLLSLVLFSALVATALRLRHRPDFHKRFMIVSCFVIFGPVYARLARLGFPVPFPVVLLFFSLMLAVYDLILLGRLHRATLWSSLLPLICFVATQLVLGSAAASTLIAPCDSV